MKFGFISNVGALLLLTIGYVSADNDFKQNFGNEFITAMKRYHAELLHQSMQNLAKLFQQFLDNFELTPTEVQQFKQRLKSVKELDAEIGDSVTVDYIKRVKEFGEAAAFEMKLFRINLNVLTNPLRQRAIEMSLANAEALEWKDVKVFQHKIYNRYHEMFQTIHEEELIAHPEYEKLDRAMAHISNLTENETMKLKNFVKYLKVFQLLAEFFEVPEYIEMFRS